MPNKHKRLREGRGAENQIETIKAVLLLVVRKPDTVFISGVRDND